jgi:AraC-like DNA-binding protein
MPTVAIMLAGSAAREQAREEIGALATVRFCETAESLLTLAAEGGVDAVVADLRDIAGSSVLPALGAIHRRTPHLPLILHCAATPAAQRDLPDFIAVARSLSLVFRNSEHLSIELRRQLNPARVVGAGETLARHLVPVVPVPFRAFVLVCAFKASPRLRVSTAAAWSGASRRTLERALRHAGLPGAGVMLGSCTALHAAWWLDVQGWSTKQVVDEMGFSHTSGVIRVLQRYFGCSVRSLREEGSFQDLLLRFETSLLPRTIPPALQTG